MRIFFLSLAVSLLLLPVINNAQVAPLPFSFPDIPGYNTLVCDFHMHSVFSDGLVWPTVRVDEAADEGIDVMAITEHIEYRPHDEDMQADHNRAYELAKPLADKKGVILIRGAEITRAMPPGHFNAIFISDANQLDTAEWQDAIRIANAQGGFVFWNHPGWRQENEIPVWYTEHSWLLENDLIKGIEIVNEKSYYPLSHQWAIDSGLTLIGNSDIHDPVDRFYKKCEGEHRAVTLVFADERSEQGIKEALLSGRTAVYYKDLLFGSEKMMTALFKESVAYTFTRVTMGGMEKPASDFNNNSSFTFILSREGADRDKKMVIELKPGMNTLQGNPSEYKGLWTVSNVHIAPGKNLKVNL